MSYYQNPFAEEFRGNWVLGDRQQALTFPCPSNAGRSADLITVWNEGPYDLAGNDTDGVDKSILNLVFSTASGNLFKQWTVLGIDVAGAVPGVTTPAEIAAILNANVTFTTFFTVNLISTMLSPFGATVSTSRGSDLFPSGSDRLVIKVNTGKQVKFYVRNGQAESVLRFNARAGVAELPSYFDRHTVSNIYAFEDCQNAIIGLDMALNIDKAVVTNATDAKGNILGYTTTIQPDWKLLKGRSGIFNVQVISFVNAPGADYRIAQIIEFPAGAKVGDMSRRITYKYPAVAVTQPNQIFECPYQLTSAEIAATP